MVLDICGLSKSFGKVKVLKNINFRIDTPRLIALVAPNGSGKSTLMNLICNLETIDEGEITVFGYQSKESEIFKSLSYMQDNSVLYNNLTGWDHINLIKGAHKLTQKQVVETLEYLKMTSYMNKRVRDYSLGMKQHLLFAMAVLPKPRLLILDEPINGLDPISVERVRQLLLDLFEKEGVTILLSSHNLDQIEQLTTDIIFLKDGSLLSEEEVVSQRPEMYSCITDSPENLITVLEYNNINYTRKTKYKFLLSMKLSIKKLFFKQCAEKEIRFFDFELLRYSLSDVYHELFGGKTL
ncbi:ABC transporter ATP-binding protein [Enterococcus rivorum]|uniref:ABC transporter domain-containing protein n=1 Tax=Enterococcus rivorum TaxID=762845 RepID=A0A1E5KWX0_9ENTE|nr:ABC transporter ATP-binding protein [Enterococcus rivorum]MBP2097284.1 ABC-2 type transport system ATP-binding protein [Enterococcus rivorum]OEH82364.1 hypothetical protein BCR26_02735 [Enterococcus rivorum]